MYPWWCDCSILYSLRNMVLINQSFFSSIVIDSDGSLVSDNHFFFLCRIWKYSDAITCMSIHESGSDARDHRSHHFIWLIISYANGHMLNVIESTLSYTQKQRFFSRNTKGIKEWIVINTVKSLYAISPKLISQWHRQRASSKCDYDLDSFVMLRKCELLTQFQQHMEQEPNSWGLSFTLLLFVSFHFCPHPPPI